MAKKKEEFKAHACEFKNEKDCEEELDEEEGKKEPEAEEEFYDEDEPEEKAVAKEDKE